LPIKERKGNEMKSRQLPLALPNGTERRNQPNHNQGMGLDMDLDIGKWNDGTISKRKRAKR